MDWFVKAGDVRWCETSRCMQQWWLLPNRTQMNRRTDWLAPWDVECTLSTQWMESIAPWTIVRAHKQRSSLVSSNHVSFDMSVTWVTYRCIDWRLAKRGLNGGRDDVHQRLSIHSVVIMLSVCVCDERTRRFEWFIHCRIKMIVYLNAYCRWNTRVRFSCHWIHCTRIENARMTKNTII